MLAKDSFCLAAAVLQPEESPAAVDRFRALLAATVAGGDALDVVAVDLAVAPLRIRLQAWRARLRMKWRRVLPP